VGDPMKRVAILISGRGSNMVSLLEGMRAGEIDGKAVLVVSNRADALGLDKARSFGVPVKVIARGEAKGRESHDRAVVAALEDAGAEIVCLAGYMRILTPFFVERYHQRLINIHPSLLPSFPGLHAQEQACAYGARISGCTVHFVDAEVDHGPIIAQAAVPVLPDDDADALAARILEQEHRIYPRALADLCADRIRLEGRRVIIAGRPVSFPGSLCVC